MMPLTGVWALFGLPKELSAWPISMAPTPARRFTDAVASPRFLITLTSCSYLYLERVLLSVMLAASYILLSFLKSFGPSCWEDT